MASRAPGSILIKINTFLIQIQLRSGLQSSRLDFDKIWLFLNWESIKEWATEVQARCWLDLVIFQVKINSFAYSVTKELEFANQTLNIELFCDTC